MGAKPGQALQLFFDTFRDHPALEENRILPNHLAEMAPTRLIDLYGKAIAIVEQETWADRRFDDLLPLYQRLFREMEQLLAREEPTRHDFIVIVPVADRPQHLSSCLASLLELCHTYHYGGIENGCFRKLSVVIADDSREPENIRRHKEIARSVDGQGIETHYFGLEEQRKQIDSLIKMPGPRIRSIFGQLDAGRFDHKGASVTRNIAYLKLKELAEGRSAPLFWFVDSDQAFRVNVMTATGEREVCGINYLYELDRIFNTADPCMVTGKVVGDPPVSPSVMAGNFLDDMIEFLGRMAEERPDAPCRFHGEREQASDAAYHDMSELFGFERRGRPFDYACDLRGVHDHRECLSRFAARLPGFFDGEHPTRRNFYAYQPALSSITAARTVYTGNYLFDKEGLEHFIPFASLKLRMAGPALGRLIRAEMGERFVSANLPMLHKRTVGNTGESEFRPGIEKRRGGIDLSGEFERQFFGDVMLFSLEALTLTGYPRVGMEWGQVADTVSRTEQRIYRKYMRKRSTIQAKITSLRLLLGDEAKWWNRLDGPRETISGIHQFVGNLDRNFGTDAAGFELIAPGPHKAQRLEEIVEALIRFPGDRQAWREFFETSAREKAR